MKSGNVHAWDNAAAHLYQIRRDPEEKHDLAAEKPEVVARLRKIAAWRRRLAGPGE